MPLVGLALGAIGLPAGRVRIGMIEALARTWELPLLVRVMPIQ